MPYNKTNWKDTIKDASGNIIEKGTPLAAKNLNKMETGIEKAVENSEKAVTDLAGVSQQLADTAVDLDTKKLDKNRGAVTSADLSQEVKEQLTGGSVAVVGENAVLKNNIVDGQVTPAKTTLFGRSDVRVNEYLQNRSITTYGYRQNANFVSVAVPVVEGETIYINKEGGDRNAIGFLVESPSIVPSDNTLGYRSNPELPTTVEVPEGARYFIWTVSGSNEYPEVFIQRGAVHQQLLPNSDMYDWGENIFENQFELNKTITQSPSSPDSRFALYNGHVTVVFPVNEGETLLIDKDTGDINRLSFLKGYPSVLPHDTGFPLTTPNLPAEISVPKTARYLTWTVDSAGRLPAIEVKRKVLKDSNSEKPVYPEVSSAAISFGGIIEHEWRSTKNHVYTTPKIFAIDGDNAIYSSTDYGQTWKKETVLDEKYARQYSNMGHRMLFKSSDNNSRTGKVRIYTDDYKLISEKGDTWTPYNENGADGKPGVDGTWVYGEYVSAPAGGNLGLGVRVMMTRNHGVTWEEKLKITDVDHIHSCRYDPYNRNHIYINTGDANVEMRNRWYASYDDGETWEHLAGGVLNEGKTPLVDGTFAHDKWMRTTAIAMGVDSGVKGRNSIFYFHDNAPSGFVRYDKTLKKFQIIFDNLEGVAYGTTITEDGMYTIMETSNPDYDLLHYVLFPANDDDIDNPDAYELHTIRLPKRNYRAMTRSSRQIDLAGNSIVGTNINYYNNVGLNLTNNQGGKSLGIRVNFGWTNDDSGNKKLIVLTKPIMPKY